MQTFSVFVSAVLIATILSGCGNNIDFPTTTAPPPLKNIVDTAREVPELSQFVAALDQAGLIDTLSAPGNFAVFAPRDNPWANWTEVAGLDDSQLHDVLQYHIVSGGNPPLTNNSILQTLFPPHSISVQVVAVPEYMVSLTVLVGEADSTHAVLTACVPPQFVLECTNGAIRCLDGILLPTMVSDMSIQA